MIKNTVLVLLIFSVQGCSSLGYYLDIMAGHSELMEKRRSISTLLEDNETRPELKKLLNKSIKIRNFASKNLYLPENDSYRKYADLQRPYAVWNVVAAPRYQMSAKKWCFLVVGCLSYRGYFSKKEAETYAEELEKAGYDVYVGGARAYSTLGWFDDPLLNTMMYKSEAYRAGIIFHELAHQLIYIEDDSAFNEAFATAVEQEGIRRWFQENGNTNEYKTYLSSKKRDNQVNALLRKTRFELEAIYKTELAKDEKEKRKKEIFSKLDQEYEALKISWDGYNGFDKWMKQELNNAHLLLVATYHEMVPSFISLLRHENNNLKKFYAKVKKIGELDKVKRRAELHKITRLANQTTN